jgi:hypothetical protein
MNVRRAGLAMAAILILGAVGFAAGGVAQEQTKAQPRPDGLSVEVRARLLDGRLAMVKEALKLDAAQLRLWAPVEAQLRDAFVARQKARAERQERRQQRAERPSLPDRLDRASQRLTERAEHAKALAAALKPFYASLSDEQKAVANVVLGRSLGEHGRRRFMRRAHHGAE